MDRDAVLLQQELVEVAAVRDAGDGIGRRGLGESGRLERTLQRDLHERLVGTAEQLLGRWHRAEGQVEEPLHGASGAVHVLEGAVRDSLSELEPELGMGAHRLDGHGDIRRREGGGDVVAKRGADDGVVEVKRSCSSCTSLR